jgi:subtilisin family serine protease
MDDQYHGPHVSGTIGGVGNNGAGVAGVAWRVKLMGLKFLDSNGSGSSSNAIKCIDYAIAKGAHILSNSWGGGGYSQALYDAINRARTAESFSLRRRETATLTRMRRRFIRPVTG